MAEEYLAAEEGVARRSPAAANAAAAQARGDREAAARDVRPGGLPDGPARATTSAKFLGFAQRPDVEQLSQQGPATPDHVIRTKPLPMLGPRRRRLRAQRTATTSSACPRKAKEKKTMLDAAPRMALDPALGFAAVGRTAKDAAIVEELYDHTIDVILRAEALGGWRALDRAAHLRHRVLGPRAGEAAQGGLAAAVRRRGGARHRRGLRHRQGVRRSRSSSAAPRWSALDRNPAIEAHVEAPRFPRRDLRPDRRQRDRAGARRGRAGASAASTCWC